MNQNEDSRGDVLCVYKGRQVRRYNLITLRLSEIEFKKIIDAEVDTGFSKKKILALSSTPCSCCENIEVIVNKLIRISSPGNKRKIPCEKKVGISRGILTSPLKEKD